MGGGVYTVLSNKFTFASTTSVQGVSRGSPTICFSSQELGLGFVEIVGFQDNSHTFGVLSSAHFSFNGFFDEEDSLHLLKCRTTPMLSFL